MAPIVTETQVRSFVDDGFLVLPNLIQAAELETLKKDLITMARGGYPCKSLKPVEANLSDKEVLES
ncbi:MAG: phytanoyl-CoA dioxygenase family protein, partial [Planctomycetota bacterium]